MMGLVNMFREGGFMMYVIAALVLPMLAIVILHAAMPRLWSAVLGAVLVFGCVGAGLFGTHMGNQMTERALAGADPDMQAALREQGGREAAHNWHFGAAVGAVGLIPLVVGEVRRLRREG